MRLAILCCALAVLPFAPVQDRSGPLIDHHQHEMIANNVAPYLR
jgi:hypothetical protein